MSTLVRVAMVLAGVAVLQPSGCAGQNGEDDTIQNFELLEDWLASVVQSDRTYNAPVTGTRIVSTPDGDLKADIVDNPVTSVGGSWVRARGVQYAEHPVGRLRWQPPVPVGAWKGVADARTFGDNCVNAPYWNKLQSILSAPMSESCLYLNVWAPQSDSGVPKANLPVLFWIHGGSFVMGGTSEYSGDAMFSYRQDFVLITANYRLGALGWLGGGAVQRSTSDGSGGNFGTQDTREALRWVRRNIGAFGGDPNRVTIFGESSGGSMVETHLASPGSNGLFQQAIMQSGAFDNYTVQTDCEASFVEFAQEGGCPTDGTPKGDDAALACLKAKPLRSMTNPGDSLMHAVANTSNSGWFSPCVDGVELVTTPEELAALGKLVNVSAVMLGTLANEGRYLMPSSMPVPNAPDSTMSDVAVWLGENYPTVDVKAALELYAPDAKHLDPWQTASLMYTDSQYLCPTRRSAQWLTGAFHLPNVYVYHLEYKPSVYQQIGLAQYWWVWCQHYAICSNMTKEDIGVGHSADLYLTFNDPRLNATDTKVGFQMIDYWVNFAHTGEPSTPPLTSHTANVSPWPSFRTGGQNTTQRLDLVSGPVTGLRDTYCDWWDATHPVPY
eukprot:m.181953 g.181953  ORF g.181953 m.181953 type:complete len:611 (+) comp14969_c0_seq4:103-1935(+)